MKLEANQAGDLAIHSYGAGWFLIDNERIESGVALSPKVGLMRLASANLPLLEAELTKNFGLVQSLQNAELLIIGAGALHPTMSVSLRRWLAQTLAGLNLGYELMSTPAACRTYNILKSEGRQVAAWLLPL